MGGVFINYRSVDDPLGAAAIHAALSSEFGEDRVFRDNESMQGGQHYPTEIRDALERVDVLIAVIGPQWLTLADGGVRRIDRDDDWVRLEIARALQRRIHVIPVVLKDTPHNARMPLPDELPPDIRPLAYLQKMDLSQLRLHTDVTRLADRVVELAPAMAVSRLFAAPVELDGPDSAPSNLLRPQQRVVAFLGRERPLADLWSWATQPAPLAAGMVTGPSGAGKTRLAMTLCDRLAADGWLAGVVSGDAPAIQLQHTARIDRPLLAVVDDVEIRSDQLVALAEAVGMRAAAARQAPTRLLLLARSGIDWLAELSAPGGGPAAALLDTIGRRPLVELDDACPDPALHYRRARAAFARRLGRDEPAEPIPHEQHLVGPLLQVHAAALNAVLSAAAQDGEPWRAVTHQDRRHWRLRARSGGQARLRTQDMAVVSTLATLCRPSSAGQAAALHARLGQFVASDADEYARWHQLLYPGRHELSPVGPGPLGDLLITTTLGAAPSITPTLARVGTEQQLRNALIVLGRAMPQHPSLRQAVVDLVLVDPDRLLPPATDVADRLDTPEPFVRALAAAAESARLQATTVLRLMDRAATAPRRHLDPLRAVLVAALPAQVLQTMEHLQPNPATPGLEPLQQAADRLTETALALAQSLFDPTGRPAPTGPDGRPIIPQPLFELWRTFSEWQRRTETDPRD